MSSRTHKATSPRRNRPELKWPARLLAWFETSKREMPWRTEPVPYRVWISEVMLQQTRVETVIPYFERFLARFPDVHALAAAQPQEVLKLWEGLGYYRRARMLHAAAKEIVATNDGKLPREPEALRRLPGFGPYTAAAVASIAYGVAEPVVDGNVLRVGARLFGSDEDITKSATHTALTERLRPALEASGDPGTFNQALMELGSLVCVPREPRCDTCPLRNDCVARREKRTAELPVKAPRKARPHKHIAVGVCWRRGKLLIGRRRDDQMLGGLWEFPGGKIESGESPEQAAVREVAEETALTVEPCGTYAHVEHGYTHFTVTITAIRCRVLKGRTRARSAAELRWIHPSELAEYPFPRANQRIIEAIHKQELHA